MTTEAQLDLPLVWPRVDLNGRRANTRHHDIECVGEAVMQPNGLYRVLANVNGALCLIEVRLRFQTKGEETT